MVDSDRPDAAATADSVTRSVVGSAVILALLSGGGGVATLAQTKSILVSRQNAKVFERAARAGTARLARTFA